MKDTSPTSAPRCGARRPATHWQPTTTHPAATDECSFPATHLVTPTEGALEEYINTVVVRYVLPASIRTGNDIPTATASTTDIVHPAVDVEKTGDAYSKTGDTITWTITIKNTGDVPLGTGHVHRRGRHVAVPGLRHAGSQQRRGRRRQMSARSRRPT